MVLQIRDARPPYVVFETRPIEDRQGSIEAGSAKYKNIDYALITPSGSKDLVEREVSLWFTHLEQEVTSERFPVEWLNKFKAQYHAWKEGQELPLEGTPIVTWPVINPAQLKELLGLRVRTVEDLAQANEETLKRLGMGSRVLKQQAEAWLASANDIGKVSSRLAALEVRNNDQLKQIENLAEKNERLAKELEMYKSAQAPAREPVKL